MVLETVGQSPLGAFIQSPLGARTIDGAVVPSTLQIILGGIASVSGDDEYNLSYFNPPGPLADPAAIGASEEFDPHLLYYPEENLTLDDSDYTNAAGGFDAWGGVAFVAQLHGSADSTNKLIHLASGSALWTYTISYVGLKPAVSRPVISGTRVAWVTRHDVVSGEDIGDVILWLTMIDVADGGNFTEVEIARADGDLLSPGDAQCYGLRARVVLEEVEEGVFVPTRNGFVVAYSVEESSVETFYLALLDASGTGIGSISRTTGSYVTLSDALAVSNTGAIYCVEDYETIGGRHIAEGLVGYDADLSVNTDLDFVFDQGFRPIATRDPNPGIGPGRARFIVLDDLCFSTSVWVDDAPGERTGDLNALDRAGNVAASLKSDGATTHPEWLIAPELDGETENGRTEYTTIANDSYDLTDLPYFRDMFPDAGYTGGLAHIYNITIVDGPPSDLTEFEGDYSVDSLGGPIGIEWNPTLGAPTIEALADDAGSVGVPYGRATGVSDYGAPGADLFISWETTIRGMMDVRNGIGATEYDWSSFESGLTWGWSLDDAPAGMTIMGSGASGSISWPSPTAGMHNVTVRLEHEGGADTESFTLTIT